MHKQKTQVLKPKDAKKKWYLVDARERVLGRLATEIASLLRGKQNPQWTPHTDSGDFVVVVNASEVRFTGNKLDKKVYYRHSGFVGGLKGMTAREQLKRCPEQVIFKAVKGMLPKTSLGRKQLTKLKIFPGNEHTYKAQRPINYRPHNGE